MQLLSQLRSEVRAAREMWDMARQEYNRAATELDKLESLRKRARGEYDDETRRELQRDLDESVLRKWSNPESLMERHETAGGDQT